MNLKLPCVLGGRYECRERIGSGGMGDVYRARHLGLERDVAVKLLSIVGEQPGQEERVQERFRREAVALSRLRHPNTVQVIDFGWTDDGRPYIVTELLKGETLDVAIQQEGPFDAGRTLHIMCQVCRSLAEAHQHGIVHRDLKPSNIFLMEAFGTHDYVKVIDFGVARVDAVEEAARNRPLTVEGTTLGTPDYMAPEQARGQRPAPATDVYALGCMMFEMLTGSPPFTGDSALQVMIKHIKQQPPTLAEARPELALPPGLEHALLTALQKQIDARPRDAGVLLDLLSEVQRADPPRLVELDSFDELGGIAQGMGEDTGRRKGRMFLAPTLPEPDDAGEGSQLIRVKTQSGRSGAQEGTAGYRRPMKLRRGVRTGGALTRPNTRPTPGTGGAGSLLVNRSQTPSNDPSTGEAVGADHDPMAEAVSEESLPPVSDREATPEAAPEERPTTPPQGPEVGEMPTRLELQIQQQPDPGVLQTVPANTAIPRALALAVPQAASAPPTPGRGRGLLITAIAGGVVALGVGAYAIWYFVF